MTLNEPSRLLGWEDLRAKGIKDSKPTIYRKIKAGRFPAPVYIDSSFRLEVTKRLERNLFAGVWP